MDDVTIEDEFESNEESLSKSDIKANSVSSTLFQILSQQWYILLVFSIVILILIYINKTRQRHSNSTVDSTHIQDDVINQYDQMERIRQRQQKAYEEQALRHAEQKKAKIELLKMNTDEKASRSKYRSDVHNPLTGQSNRGSGDSCSWRPSSKRKPAGG